MEQKCLNSKIKMGDFIADLSELILTQRQVQENFEGVDQIKSVQIKEIQDLREEIKSIFDTSQQALLIINIYITRKSSFQDLQVFQEKDGKIQKQVQQFGEVGSENLKVLIEQIWLQQIKGVFEGDLGDQLKKIKQSLLKNLDDFPLNSYMGEISCLGVEFEFKWNQFLNGDSEICWTRLEDVNGLIIQYGIRKNSSQILSNLEDKEFLKRVVSEKGVAKHQHRPRFVSEDLTKIKNFFKKDLGNSEHERKQSYPQSSDGSARTRTISQKNTSIFSNKIEGDDITIQSQPDEEEPYQQTSANQNDYQLVGMDEENEKEKKLNHPKSAFYQSNKKTETKNQNKIEKQQKKSDSIEIIMGSNTFSEKYTQHINLLKNNLAEITAKQLLKFEDKGLFHQISQLTKFYENQKIEK